MAALAYRWWVLLAIFAHWRLRCALEELDDIERHGVTAPGFAQQLRSQAQDLTRLWLRYEGRAAMAASRGAVKGRHHA